MLYLSKHIRERLERKLATLNALRPLPSALVAKLREQFQVEMTYNSNAIEGNSLTLKETFLVINEGITIKGKPLKDHLEVKDHKAALEYLYDLLERGKQHTLSEQLVRSLHQLVVRDTDREWAGRYRNSSVMIMGAKHQPPDASKVPSLMHGAIEWIRMHSRSLHCIERAAFLHYKLAAIHPFFDGNGRTARLAMNVLLMQAGYPLVIILKHDRRKYYRVLAKADDGDHTPFVLFIAQAVERSLDMYLKVATPIQKKKEIFSTLSFLSKGTPYSAKYLNLLVRAGKLEAHKEGRTWVASREALERYVQGRERIRSPRK